MSESELQLEVIAQFRAELGQEMGRAIPVVQFWSEWRFPASGVDKFVNRSSNQDQPKAGRLSTMPINAVLTGAYCHTSTDIFSMEAATEAGIDAARALDSEIDAPKRQWKPLGPLRAIDTVLFKLGLPHVFWSILIIVLVRVCAKMSQLF